MRLTKNNYFTPDNNYLTSSKIKDYLFDPYYFYRKHLLHIVPWHDTPQMRIGKAADTYLTFSRAAFRKQYAWVERRNLKNPTPGLTELTKTEYDSVMGIISSVKDLTIYRNLKKNFKSQRILSYKMPVGAFEGLAGVPDWYSISAEGTDGIIVDLKCTSSVDLNKFKYIAHDFNYYLQQAMYAKLLKLTYPGLLNISSYILAVEYSDPYRTALFKLDDMKIAFAAVRLENTIEEISMREDYKPKDINWDNSVEL